MSSIEEKREKRIAEVSSIEEERERTLWIGNLPCWIDEKYLCLCFFHFKSLPICFQSDFSLAELGEFVKIEKCKKTALSKGYGFMTFQTHDEAEKILYAYNGVKVMPGTKDRFFCLKWHSGSKRANKIYKRSEIETMSNSSNDESQNTTQIQFANSNVQVQEYSNFGSSSRLSHIPHDLMDDILFRLPAYSITRLRMTCRAWASMTTKPRFTYKHLKERMKQNDPIVIFERSNGEDKLCFLSNYSSEQACSFRILHFKLPYGFVKWNGSCTLSNSCNGLVCVYASSFVNVVNPTIRETVQLTKNFAIFKQLGDYTFSVGIGYDDSLDAYKIVRIFGNFFSGTEYEVFTLGGSSNASCKWRQIEGIPNYIAANDMAPVFLNGAIHWLLRIGNYINGKSKSKLILAFDVRTEATRMLPVPEGLRFCRLLELGGCLCIIENENWNSKVANLYILKDYDNCKWKKEQTIDFFPSWSRPVATRDGKLLFPPYYYDTKDGTSGNFFSLSNPSTREECNNIFHGCAESLVSPISYLQRSDNPCAVFPIFGQRWAAQFPMNDPSC